MPFELSQDKDVFVLNLFIHQIIQGIVCLISIGNRLYFVFDTISSDAIECDFDGKFGKRSLIIFLL